MTDQPMETKFAWNDDILPIGITAGGRQRQRRRRREPLIESSCNDDTNDNLENIPNAKEKNGAENQNKGIAGDGKIQSKSSDVTTSLSLHCNDGSDTDDNLRHKEALRLFRNAANEKSVNLFRNNSSEITDLGEYVVHASLIMPMSITTGCIVLEDNVMNILKECRKLVKELSAADSTASSSRSQSATSKTKNRKNTADKNNSFAALDSLCLVVHGLRAIAPIVVGTNASSSNRDTTILLLYHTIVSIEKMCRQCLDERQQKSLDDIETIFVCGCRAMTYCIAAYEALGYVLCDYTVKISGSTDHYVSLLAYDPGRRDNKSISSCFPRFPIPVEVRKGKATISGTYTFDQLSGMVLTSIVAMVKVITTICTNYGNSIKSDESEFVVGTLADLLTMLQSTNENTVNMVRVLGSITHQKSIPWIKSLIFSSKESKPVETAVAYGYKLFKIMWETAKNLSDPRASFLLQKDALMVYMIHSDANNKSTDSTHARVQADICDTIVEKHFEKACSCAWKAAETFCNRPTSSSLSTQGQTLPSAEKKRELLELFYEDVGNILDSLASCRRTKVFDASSYVEYCAYRAAHTRSIRQNNTTNCNCIFQMHPFRYVHRCGNKPNEEKSTATQATLSLFFLIVRLKEIIDTEANLSSMEMGQLNKTARYNISLFQNTLFKVEDGKLNVVWHCKLLLILNPHQLISFTNNNQAGTNTYSKSSLSEIVLKCINPLWKKAITCNELDTKQRNQMWKSMIQGSIIAIKIYFDARGQEIHDQTDVDRQVLDEFVDCITCDFDGIEKNVGLIEKAAQCLSSIGKKKFDLGEADTSLSFLLYSMKIFLFVWPTAPASSILNMQVSNRFAFMAKVYKSVEKFDEAIIALIYSLTFHAAEASLLRTNSDDSFHKLLLGMTELTKDVTGHCPDDYVSDSKKRQGLVRDLFSLLHHKNRSEVNSESFGVLDKPNATKMIDVLLKKSYGSSTILSTGLLCSNVLDALVTDEVVPLTPVFNGSSIRNEKIMIATELMMKLGCFLEDHAESEKHQIFASISEYERCHHIIKNFIAQTCDDHTKKQLIMALINIAASFFLISRETTFDFSRLAIEARCAKTKQVPPRYLTISIQFADKAATSMRLNRNLDSVLLVLMTSVSFATDLYQLRLHSFLEKNDVPFAVDVDPRELQNTVAFLGKTKSQSIFTRLTKQILSHVLLRSCNLFSLDGELINSAKMAHLNSLMHSDREISETSWIESIALSSFSTTAVMPSSLSSDFRPETAVSPEQLEVMACRLRLLIHKSNADDEIQNIGNRLRCLMETLQRYQRRPALDNTTACLLQWIKTTIAIALAECDKRVSQLFSAMDLFRHCFAECKVMFSSFSLSAKETSTHTHTQFWRNHQITMLMSRCLTRQIECLERIAVLYTRLGDHRKALQYGKLVVTTAGLNVDTGTNSPMSFSKLIAITRESTCRNCDEIRLRRFFLRLLAAGTPITSLVKEFQNGETALSKVELPSRTCKRSENRMFEELADLGATHDMLYLWDSLSPPSELIPLQTKINIMEKKLNSALRESDFISDSSFLICPKIRYHNTINRAQSHLIHFNNRRALKSDAISELKGALEFDFLSTACRAKALYLLGTSSLERVKRSGYLDVLWQGMHCCSPFSREIVQAALEAKQCFTEAALLMGSDCSVFTRHCQRNLALITGLAESTSIQLSCASLLTNASIGRGTRQRFLRQDIQTSQSKTKNIALEMLDALDNPCGSIQKTADYFVNVFAHHFPPGWRFISAALCPTGELLLTSIEINTLGQSPTQKIACIFPDEEGGRSSMYNEILQPLDDIILRSQKQLAGEITSDSVGEKDRYRDWWNERIELNSRLEHLLDLVQSKLFQCETAREILCGLDSSSQSEEHDNLCGRNLELMFSALHVNDRSITSDQCVNDSTETLAMESTTISEGGHVRQHGETDMEVHDDESKKNSISSTKARKYASSETSGCVFLILDENLQRFPFESMRCFSGKEVCRLPSLGFAVAKVLDLVADGLKWNSKHTSFILDPEANLGATRERILPLLESWNDSCGLCWKGCVGLPPPSGFIEDALTTKNGLLLYIGHGNGRQYFSNRNIEALRQKDKSNLTICYDSVKSSIVLMGCSSGKLDSINRDETTAQFQVPLHYEPDGLALSYLMSGAPCVIGNLWDVTDRDIDRFSMSLLSSIHDPDDNRSMAQRVSDSRTSCKMNYIVGGAPVCYGFPVIPVSEFDACVKDCY